VVKFKIKIESIMEKQFWMAFIELSKDLLHYTFKGSWQVVLSSKMNWKVAASSLFI
jgi:hypothetical protein